MPASAQAAAEVTLGKLTLRVRGPAGAAQTVVLTSECCRIGSGEGCTLRLRAPGIRNVHCVISRGPRRTVVRGLTKETWLNGAVFFESPLAVGDCLRLGPLEIDVLTDERIGGDADTTGTDATWTPTSADEGSSEGADGEVWSADAVGQLQQLVADQTADLRATAAETPVIEPPPQAPPEAGEGSPRAIPRQDVAPQATSCVADAFQEMRDLENRLGERLGWLEDQSRRLEQAGGGVGDLRSAWEAESRQWRAEQQQAEADQRESLGNLDRRVNDLSDAVDELRRQTQSLVEEFRGLQSEQTAADQELQRRFANLETEWAAASSRESARETAEANDLSERTVEADRSDTPEPPDRLPREAAATAQSLAGPDGEGEPAFEQVSREAPLSTLEVLRRMGASLDFSADNEAPAVPRPPARTAAASPPAERPRPAAAVGHGERQGQQEDGDSIEQYMSQLLGRMRAGTARVSSSDADPAPAKASGEPSSAARERSHPAVQRIAYAPRQFAPRAPAPELTADFSAMRALANNTARQALDTHRRRRQARSTRGKLLVAAVALVLSFALLWLSTGGSRVALWCAIASLLVSIYWGGRYIRLTRQLRGKPGRDRLDDEEQASEEPAAAPQTDDDLPAPEHAESAAATMEDADMDNAVMHDVHADDVIAELAGVADRPI